MFIFELRVYEAWAGEICCKKILEPFVGDFVGLKSAKTALME